MKNLLLLHVPAGGFTYATMVDTRITQNANIIEITFWYGMYSIIFHPILGFDWSRYDAHI